MTYVLSDIHGNLENFNQLNEKQLEGFIAMYNGFLSVNDDNDEYTQEERDNAFEHILSLSRPIPNIDEKAELAAYRDERFGQ